MCGGNLRPGARVCGSCGTPVPGAEPVTTHAAAAGRPQAVIPRSGVNASAQQPGGQVPSRQPSQSRPVSSQAQAPVTIVINGQQTSGSGYSGMRGYRCGTCGSFVYDGGPSCGCGWGIGDFIALGLEMEAVDDLFTGDTGDAAEDLLLAGMVSSGGVGYRPYGGGMLGYGPGGMAGGGFVTDMLLLGALDQRDDQQAFQQGYEAGAQADQGQGFGDQGYSSDQYGQQGYPDQGGYGGGTFTGDQGGQDGYVEYDDQQDVADPGDFM